MTRRRAALAASFLLVALFYAWIASAAAYGLPHYASLARGFLAGHLHLDIPPAPALLALPDPRDPERNEGLRLHDASLYNGRYYLYFGPAPALTAYVPWRAVTGRDLPNGWAAVVFAFAGYVGSCALLFALARQADVNLPTPFAIVSVLALGLCQFVPFVLRRPAVYEVAILAGYAFFMWAAFAFTRHRYAVAALLFGLAVGSRPHYVLAAFVFWAALVLARRRDLRGVAAFTAPLVLCGLALAWYNFARFGNPLELGINYMLGGARHLQHARFAPKHLLPGLYYFLVAPPQLLAEFPFVRLAPSGFPIPYYYFLEPVAGIFATVPATLAAFVTPRPARPLLFSSAAMLLFLSFTGWVTVRYSVDFVPALLVAALLACRRWPEIAAATLIFGMFVNTGISFTGYDDGFRERHPESYYRIAGWFGAHREPAIDAEFDIVFPEKSRRRTEPLLTAGDPYAGHIVAVRRDGPSVRVLSSKWGSGGRSSEPIPIVPNISYRIRVLYCPDTAALEVRWNGETVLTHQAAMYPTTEDKVLIGANRINPSVFGAFFSGSVHVLTRVVTSSELPCKR